MLHPLPGLKNNIKREDRLTGPLFLWLVRYYTYERQNDTKRPARCAFHRARYTYPASPVMHIPVPRRGRRSCWPIARFCPLLPLLAKVGRSGERNIPAPEGAEPSLPEARRRGPPHSSLYPWLRIKFTLSRQFAPPDVPSGGNPVISPLHGGNESRLRNSANSRRTRGGPLRRTGKLADSICAKRLTPRYTPGCG